MIFVGWQFWCPLKVYSSSGIIRIVKSRRIRWVGHVAQKGEKRNANRWESQKERDH
jgi:hypothetical protein